MGKTRTVAVDSEDKKEKKPVKKREAKKKSLKEQKGVRIPGLKGGERVVAVEAEPIPVEEEGKEKKEKKAPEPKVRSKRYKEAKAKVDRTKLYSLPEALKLVKEISYSKFDGTVELHLVTKKDGLSFIVTLPHSTGKKKKVEIANEDTIKELKKGKIDFDVLLSTPEMMPKLAPFAKLLGPRGQMPNPKNGTLIKDKKEAEKFTGNNLFIKTEKKAPLIHTTIGKVSQKDKELVENAEAIIQVIGKRQVKKAHLTSTMGPSLKIDVS